MAPLTARPLRAQTTGTTAACAIPVPLRDALERVAGAARVRLSYSRELIAVDRPVCPPVITDGDPVAALDRLLRGTGVAAVAVGGGQIVLTPAAHADSETTGAATRPAVLERVVVTGSPAGAPSRALPVALSVLDGAAVSAGRAQAPLSTALDGAVPGLWLWTQPTTSVLARYGGVRGASSFGLTTPKIYLDGVEVANPLLVTALTAEQVERVEVIRGPQGAALYGADAISGVINVVTRHDGAEGVRPTLTLRTGLGAAGTSSLVAGPALAQDYGATLRAGHGARTGGVAVTASTLGPVVPGTTARQVTAVADGRRVSPHGVLTLTARFADAAAPPAYPLTTMSGTAASGAAAGGTPAAVLGQGGTTPADTTATNQLTRQHVSELTLAATAVRTNDNRWTHTFTAGVDAYRVSGVSSEMMAPISSPLDFAQRASRGSAARATLRASSTATYDVARDVALTVTGLADYGLLRDATRLDTAGYAMAKYDSLRGPAIPLGGSQTPLAYRHEPPPGYAGGTPAATPVTTLGTGGLVGQTTVAWRDALFVTAGLRAERNDGFTAASRTALLPALGVSAVRALGAATLKLRGAYGSGLRPARTAARAATWHSFGGGALSQTLAPESQTGVEAGADLFTSGGAGRPALALHVTAFDQRASDLIQPVAVARSDDADDRPFAVLAPSRDAAPADGPRRALYGAREFEYVLQNVGVISNRGAEAEAELRAADGRAGALTLGGTFSYVDSRVRRTAAGYLGELRAGDRVLEVPRFTLGATAAWRRAAWRATLGAARASDWINYDRLALNAAAANVMHHDDDFSGPALRRYWRTYTGVTRLRAEFTRDLSRGLSLTVLGENLLDRQRGEPDNATVLPGRTITAGVRARF